MADEAAATLQGAESSLESQERQPVYTPSAEEIRQCSIVSWYRKLRHLTFASRMIPLPDDFIEYLKDEGTVRLPKRGDPTRLVMENTEIVGDGQGDPWEYEGEDDEDESLPSFDRLSAQIDTAVSQLGGTVFPKLDWSSPQDAAWVNLNRSLACQSAGQIYLLLKSSQFIQHDLAQPYGVEGVLTDDWRPTLVLRNYVSVQPGLEFRCFVRKQRLVAISQRKLDQAPDFAPEYEDELVPRVFDLWTDVIHPRLKLDSYIFDVFAEDGRRMWLVDVNPYSERLDSCLFTWEELEELADTPLDLDDQAGNEQEQTFSTDAEVEQFLREQGKLKQAQDEGTSAEAAPSQVAVEQDSTSIINQRLLASAMSQIAFVPEMRLNTDPDEDDDDASGEKAAALLDAVVFRSADDSTIRSSSLATYAYPQDVVELASTQDVANMIRVMQEAGAVPESDSGEER